MSSSALCLGAVAAIVIATGVSAARAAPGLVASEGLGRTHTFKDWVVACDNTRACEAQGYQVEGEPSVVLILKRAAGPGAALGLRIGFGDTSPTDGSEVPAPKVPVTLRAGSLRLTLPAPAPETGFIDLTAEQVQALRPWLLRAERLQLGAAGREWSVSLAGATAALLKMDDLQGRVGTPGALARPGTRAESSVPPPAPVPKVSARPIPAARGGDTALLPAILKELQRVAAEDCPLLAENKAPQDGQVFRLSERQVLVVFACWMAAYNGGSAAWIANDRPPYAPVLAGFDPGGEKEGSSAPTFPDFTRDQEGLLSVHSAHKGRGIADCFSVRTWFWDGKRFALTEATESPCRLFTAGGLPMTLWRAEPR